MAEVFAIVEHRQGQIRDITFELLTLGRKLAKNLNTKCTAILFADDAEKFINKLRTQADRIIVMENSVFSDFNAEVYQIALAEIFKKESPFLILMGHTAMGIDLGPSLATQLNIPFSTDCLDVQIINGKLRVMRSMYDGKLNAKILLKANPSYLITYRSGSIPVEMTNLNGDIVKFETPINAQPEYRKFIGYIEAAVGAIDITKADVVVAVGRGIKDRTNLPMIEDFAKAIGGVLGCTRPVVDAGWLPKEHQVGSSGKTVKPKLYIALGISGAFQHIMGMKNSETIIAINKDPNAPIFNEADYGIVDDLFKVVPVLKNKILEIKQAKGIV
ncbi:MAG: electron transfer flavoprotein subunit alpha/FixB family protein [candidate division WOR-3 bacterium]|nr:electron transfer flavoprotein subunit alpha/FixB family protein [candidate division WOR-3 bacterium]